MSSMFSMYENTMHALTSTTWHNLNITRLGYSQENSSRIENIRSDLITRTRFFKTGLMAVIDLVVSATCWVFSTTAALLCLAQSKDLNGSSRQFRDHSIYSLHGIFLGTVGVFAPSWAAQNCSEVFGY